MANVVSFPSAVLRQAQQPTQVTELAHFTHTIPC